MEYSKPYPSDEILREDYYNNKRWNKFKVQCRKNIKIEKDNLKELATPFKTMRGNVLGFSNPFSFLSSERRMKIPRKILPDSQNQRGSYIQENILKIGKMSIKAQSEVVGLRHQRNRSMGEIERRTQESQRSDNDSEDHQLKIILRPKETPFYLQKIESNPVNLKSHDLTLKASKSS